MAFRIEESVIRGEVDNRTKGIVWGKIWLIGRADPMVLELQGNAWLDLAGCLLTFTNPRQPVAHQHLDLLHPLQRGTIGDLTASRKVRVFDVPLEEALAMYDRKEKPPEHLANCLYLEWYSDSNGRAMIESADCELTVSTPEWRLAPEENEERARQAAQGMDDFMSRLENIEGFTVERLEAPPEEDEDEDEDKHEGEGNDR